MREFKFGRLSLCAFVFTAMAFGGGEWAQAEAPMCRAPRSAVGRSPSSDSVAGTPDIKIIQLDPDLPLKELELEGYEVISYDEFTSFDPWTAPDPNLRDEIFQASSLSEHLKGWDHFKRDMLFLRAQEQGLEALVKKYPELPKNALKMLIRVIEEEKKKRGRE